jgi:peptidoglycan/LPS O-acetylase OafA/YrhL
VSTNNLYHFFLNLFYVQFWGFQSGVSFNMPAWSVSVEEAIYVVFFFLHRIIFAGGIVLPLAIAGMGYAVTITGTPMWHFGICAMYFFTGVVLYFYLLKFRASILFSAMICAASIEVVPVV